MHSKGNEPSAAQVVWREEVRALGCIVSREQSGIEIHHVVGASAKHQGQEIGHWFILPLTTWYHRTNPTLNVTDNKRYFEANFESQVSLFKKLLNLYRFMYDREPPVPAEVIEAIVDLERDGFTEYKAVA